MKKVIACITALLLCMTMAVPVFAEAEFTPSVTNKPAPEVVPVMDPDGNPAIGVILDDNGQIIGYVYEGCLVVTAVADAETSTLIPEDSRDVFLDVYNKLTNGQMTIPYEKHNAGLNAGDMVIRDLFDASFICEEHPKMLEPEGVAFQITFDLGVAENVDVYTMSYIDGEWAPIVSTVNNGDGTVTCTFEKLCPVEFSVRTSSEPPVQTGDDGDGMYLWLAVAVLALAAIVVLVAINHRSARKDKA